MVTPSKRPKLSADTVDDHVHWAANTLVVDGHATALIAQPYLSPSAANAVASCPARFAIERCVPRPLDPHSAADLGSAAHTVLEHLYRLSPPQRTPTSVDQLVDTVAAEQPTDSPARLRTEIAERTHGIFSIENPSQVQVAATEWAVPQVTVSSVPVLGVIDRVDATAGGQVTLVDYKTGAPSYPKRGSDDPAGDQLRTYALAVAEHTGQLPVQARLLFTRHGRQRTVRLGTEALAATSQKLRSSWHTLNSSVAAGQFAATPSKLCGWCPLAQSCPAAPSGLQTRVEQLPVAGPAASGAGGPVPAHPTGRNHIDTKEPAMNTGAQPSPVRPAPTYPPHAEPKPWVTTYPTGELNPNTYAAVGLYGLTTTAADVLEHQGVAMTVGNVTAFAQTLATIVAQAQMVLTDGNTSPQTGLHTRLRGAMHSALKAAPAPFGGTSTDWDQWTQRIVKRLIATDSAVQSLWSHCSADPVNARPWEQLARTQPSEQEVAAS